jgi:hypothetical protein
MPVSTESTPVPVPELNADYLETYIIENPNLAKYISALAKRRLRFVWGNDPAIEREDLEAELMLKACEAARKCEEKGIGGRHTTNTLRVAVTNHCLNIATKYGATARNPLTRVHKAQKFRTAWWADVGNNRVHKVLVSTLPQHRKDKYILTKNAEGQQQYCSILRLYDTEKEAIHGLWLYSNKEGREAGKRNAALDLTVDHDDFSPTLKSLDRPAQEEAKSKNLYDYLGVQDPETQEIDLTQIKNKKVRECVALMLNSNSDALFTLWLQRRGCDIAELSYRDFFRAAMDYSGVTVDDLREHLAEFKD